MTVVIDPTESDVIGLTLDDLVSKIRRRLKDRDNLNKLNGPVGASDATVILQYRPSNLSRGSILSIEDEVLHVWENTTTTVAVERGYDGTLATSHDEGTLVYENGKTRAMIVDAVNDELMSLNGQGLYQMRSLVVPNFSSGTFGYPLSDLIGATVYDVQVLTPGQNYDWRPMPQWSFNSIDNTVIFDRTWFYSNQVRVLYKAPFNRLNDGQDSVQSTAGLQEEAADILTWGALYRLTINDEYIRDDFRTQGDTRRPSEVPAGAVLRSTIAGFKAERDNRIKDARDQLLRKFPPLRPGW